MSLARAPYDGNNGNRLTSSTAAANEHEWPTGLSRPFVPLSEPDLWMRWGRSLLATRDEEQDVPPPRTRRVAPPRIPPLRTPSADSPRAGSPAAVPRTHLLRPRLLVDAIPRARLVAALERGLQQPLILVCGPAGAGKTTLLGQWLAALPPATPPAAWLSLSERTSRLPAFARAFIAAIQMVAPAVGGQTLALLDQTRQVPPAVLGRRLADELLALPEDVLLVLDDYHTVADGRVHTLLDALLDHPAPRLHLVLASRYQPPLALARLRARGEMLEVRTADLRFTLEETSAFLRAAVGAVDETTATQVQARTEGWAAGVRLATLAPAGSGEPLAPGSHGRREPQLLPQTAAIDYLIEEVLAHQPPALQAFLVRTAVLEALCAPLCDTLLAVPLDAGGSRPTAPARRMNLTSAAGTGATLLAEALQRDLFLVPLDAPDAPANAIPAGGGPAGEVPSSDVGARPEDAPAWYRYQHLFREALLHQLRAQVGQAGVQALRAAAGRWLAAHGLGGEAVRHIEEAGGVAGAAGIAAAPAAPSEDRLSAASLPTVSPAAPAPEVANTPGLVAQLTYREEEVLAGLLRRLSNKEIARELGISTATVKRHAANLYAKLGVRTRREAERRANALGLLPSQPQSPPPQSGP